MKRKMMAAESPCRSGETCNLSELRLVLLGRIWSGKSLGGNIILGGEHFDPEGKTMESVKSQNKVGGKQVIVVDTPGWWKNSSAQNTPELVKQEIVHSISLCYPGPHAFLLVVDVDSPFTEKHRGSVDGHLELLGERVWRHTIVLYNCGGWTRDATSEQLADSGGSALEWLVDKCGGRSQSLKSADTAQVMELLEKIEKMVAGNGGCHYTAETILQGVEEKRLAEAERANQRLVKVQKEREALRALLSGEARHLSDLRIVMLGWTMVGKTSTGNTILGTLNAGEKRTIQCGWRQGKVDGRRVTVVDTPGWWMHHSIQDTPLSVKKEIVRSVSLCPPGPHVFLLVIDASISFTETHRRTIQEHTELFSKDVWRHTIVLFAWGEWLGHMAIERYIESEGQALQWLMQKCGNRYHVLSNEEQHNSAQVTELLEKVEEMVAVNSVFHLGPESMDEAVEASAVGLYHGEMELQHQAAGMQLIAMFEELSKRREQEMLENIRKILVHVDGASIGGPPNLTEDTPSEVSSCKFKWADEKVSVWLKLNHSTSAASGYESGSASGSVFGESDNLHVTGE